MKRIEKNAWPVLFALYFLFGCAPSRTKIEYYTFCDTIEASSLYRVWVDGREVFVFPTAEPQIAQFGCNGAVHVEVEYLGEELHSAEIRPLAKKYAWRREGKRIYFTLTTLDQVSVEVNGDLVNPLFIFANPPERREVEKARHDPATLFYGAGKVYDNGADTLTLLSGQRLYIEGGAIVRGILRADSVENITIAGCGYLDARFTGQIMPLVLYRSRNISFNHLTLLNRDWWSCVCMECDDLEFVNFKSIATASSNPHGHENDALNLVGCRNAKLRHCFAYAHDDAFCIKARKWKWGRSVSNILYEACIGWNVHAGNTFEIGYEAGKAGEYISDISYRNIYAIHSARPKYNERVFRRGAVSIHNGANATISGVTFENVFIEDPAEYAIHIAIVQSSYNIGHGVEWEGGNIRDIRFDHVRILCPAPEGSEIYGVNDLHAVENIVFRNLYHGDKHVRSLEEGDFRKAVYCRNIVFE